MTLTCFQRHFLFCFFATSMLPTFLIFFFSQKATRVVSANPISHGRNKIPLGGSISIENCIFATLTMIIHTIVTIKKNTGKYYFRLTWSPVMLYILYLITSNHLELCASVTVKTLHKTPKEKCSGISTFWENESLNTLCLQATYD